MIATYLAGDVTGAWTRFFAQANIAVPDGLIEQMLGGDRNPNTVADERFWFAHELLPSVSWRPDLTAPPGCSTRAVNGAEALVVLTAA